MSKAYIYLSKGSEASDKDFEADNLPKLPQFRRERYLRYSKEQDRKACILSYLLLARGLDERYGIKESVSFVYNKNGKPYLKEYPRVFFSISHCKGGVACALSDAEIGIDIQDVRPFDIGLAGRVCTQAELKLLAEASDPARLFTRLWTQKESRAKAEGTTLTRFFKLDLPTDIFFSREEPEFFLTLCHMGKLSPADIILTYQV